MATPTPGYVNPLAAAISAVVFDDGAGAPRAVTPTVGLPVATVAARATQSATIASGASVSAAIDLLSTALIDILMPDVWGAAALTIEVSANNSKWYSLVYDENGLQINSWPSPVQGAAYTVAALGMLGFRYIRLRSGTGAVPVNQGADRVFTLITRPLA